MARRADHGSIGRERLAAAFLDDVNSDTAETRWQSQAECRGSDPSVFFPDSQTTDALRPALFICKGCPVRQQCLDWALDTHQEFGIWGGMTEGDRKRVRRRRFRAGRSAVAS